MELKRFRFAKDLLVEITERMNRLPAWNRMFRLAAQMFNAQCAEAAFVIEIYTGERFTAKFRRWQYTSIDRAPRYPVCLVSAAILFGDEIGVSGNLRCGSLHPALGTLFGCDVAHGLDT